MLIEECLLIRLPITPGVWAEDIPPVPDGFQASLVFGRVDDALTHAEAMGVLGYTVANIGLAHTVSDPDTIPFADIMIERRLANAHPRWRDRLVANGAKVYDLSMGPVQRFFNHAIDAHRHVWMGTGTSRSPKTPVYLRAIS